MGCNGRWVLHAVGGGTHSVCVVFGAEVSGTAPDGLCEGLDAHHVECGGHRPRPDSRAAQDTDLLVWHTHHFGCHVYCISLSVCRRRMLP